MVGCDALHGHEADIMPVVGVFPTRVSESDQEFHFCCPKKKCAVLKGGALVLAQQNAGRDLLFRDAFLYTLFTFTFSVFFVRGAQAGRCADIRNNEVPVNRRFGAFRKVDVGNM